MLPFLYISVLLLGSLQNVFAQQPKFVKSQSQIVACPTGTDKRHPTVLSDVDQNASLDHIGVTKKNNLFIVTLYTAKSFAPTASWKFSGEQISVASTRRIGTPNGDLWVDVKRGEHRWLYHLQEGKLIPIYTKGFRYDLRFDIDNDGIIDPFIDSKQGVMVLINGKLISLPTLQSTIGLFGERIGYGLEGPINVDNTGKKALVYSLDEEIYLFHLDNLSRQEKPFAKGYRPHLLQWGKNLAVISLIDGFPHVWSVESPLEILATYTTHRSIFPVPNLVLPTPYTPLTQGWLIDSYNPEELFFGNFVWAKPAENHPMKTLPLQLNQGPRWVGVRSIAFAGANKSEIVEVDPMNKENPIQRVIFKQNHHADAYKMKTFVTDLNGDGIGEILVNENSYGLLGKKSDSYEKSRWLLLDGDGKILWQDEFRFSRVPFEHHSGMASPRIIEWTGEGDYAIQFRTDKEVFYVLPTTTDKSIPLCLE